LVRPKKKNIFKKKKRKKYLAQGREERENKLAQKPRKWIKKERK